MKKIMILMFLLLISLIACEKTDQFNDLKDVTNTVSELNAYNGDGYCTTMKMVPLKGEIVEIADFTVPPVFCGPFPYPGRFLDIKGTMTHFGNVEGGYADILNCNSIIIDGQPHFIAEFEGIFQAANGDIINYDGSLWFMVENPTVGGSQFFIYDGSGKWKGAKGCFNATTTRLDELTILISVDGKITPPGVIK